MIPAVLLPLYVSFAYDMGRCSVWMTSDNEQQIERALQQTASRPVWRSYLRGREAVKVKGMRWEMCDELNKAYDATFLEIAAKQ